MGKRRNELEQRIRVLETRMALKDRAINELHRRIDKLVETITEQDASRDKSDNREAA